jgi:hypothetical protein
MLEGIDVLVYRRLFGALPGHPHSASHSHLVLLPIPYVYALHAASERDQSWDQLRDEGPYGLWAPNMDCALDVWRADARPQTSVGHIICLNRAFCIDGACPRDTRAQDLTHVPLLHALHMLSHVPPAVREYY